VGTVPYEIGLGLSEGAREGVLLCGCLGTIGFRSEQGKEVAGPHQSTCRWVRAPFLSDNGRSLL
jgi:hypothetical protein